MDEGSGSSLAPSTVLETSNSSKMWWSSAAYGRRALDWYQHLLSHEKHANPESYLNRAVEASGRSPHGVPGYIQLPSPEFLDQAYKLIGDLANWNSSSGWESVPPAFTASETPSMFERWKDARSKRDGFVLGADSKPSTTAALWRTSGFVVSGVMYQDRARVISRVADWTYDEAEHIAVSLSMQDAPGDVPIHLWRSFAESSMVTENNVADWSYFLSNPNLPLGETEGLFRDLAGMLISSVEKNDLEPRIVNHLSWLLQNPNTPGDDPLNDVDVALFNATQDTTCANELGRALIWHPNWAGHIPAEPGEAVRELTDEWLNRTLRYVKAGDDIAAESLRLKASSMLSNPACEEQIQHILATAWEVRDFHLLHAFSPAAPAVLEDLEIALTGDVGNVPLEWVLDVAGLGSVEEAK